MKALNWSPEKKRKARPKTEELIKDKDCIGCVHLCNGCPGKPRKVANCLNYKERRK